MRALVIVALLAARVEAAPRVVIPQIAAPVQCDGELDELAWRTPARTGPFVAADGTLAAPYSEARFLRDDHSLYLALYAADEDVKATDEFVVTFAAGAHRKTFHFAAGAAHSANLAVDLDGTLDDPRDDDEEWVVEAALPLAALPFRADGSVDVHVVRCDVTKDGKKHCGSWSGALVRR